MAEKLQERYLLRWTTYRQLKRNGLPQTKTQRLKDGSYKTYAHFEKKGKYFLRVTRWKFLESDKTYSKITKSWDEHCYDKQLRKELNKFRKSNFKEFNAGIQKFTGKITSARNRKIKGKISHTKYIRTTRKDIKKYGNSRYVVELEEQIEDTQMFPSGSFEKRKRKRKKKRGKKNVKGKRFIRHINSKQKRSRKRRT